MDGRACALPTCRLTHLGQAELEPGSALVRLAQYGPVLRTAAGVRPRSLAVEHQGHRQHKFCPFYVRLHWHRFGAGPG
jgi:hypothetical protein